MTDRSARAPADRRRAYIDWARGLAVLVMIEAHALDAWTRPADRHGPVFGNARVLGGFAAPLFLWLAGLALVLSASRIAARRGRAAAVDAICRRGLEIFVLAFLFRLQAFVVSPGSHLITLFRVDILNIMGPAIAAAGLVWGASRSRARLACLYAAIAGAIALATPLIRVGGAVDALPVWFQWYVRPAGDHTNFTLFPWSGFVFAGAAAGVVIEGAIERSREGTINGWLAVAGALLAGAGLYTARLPTIYARSSFWTSSPTFFAIRLGVMMLALAGLYGLWLAGGRVARALLRPVEEFGRHSLFVYWIHVELVYGYASWLWRRRLPLWGTLVGYLIFAAAMYGAVRVKVRVTTAWRLRQAGRAARPATA